MEVKLMMAAAGLPEPCLHFSRIKEAAKKETTKQPRTLRRLILAAVLLLCLSMTVFAYGKHRYGLWSGYSSCSFADVQILSRRYDYNFPETLGSNPFVCMSTTFGAPQGSSYWKAILLPTYKLHSVTYGNIDVSFGSTEQETWKYHFSVADDGSCSEENVKPESQSAVEYEGHTVYFYAIDDRYSARWEDELRKLVIDITCVGAEDFETTFEVVKILIELNA